MPRADCAAATGAAPPFTKDAMSDHGQRLEALDRARWRIAGSLTAAMMLMYFGFIALIAYDKPLLARPVGRGLTLGILLGALVIVVSWLLTWVYVHWANSHYDAAVRDLRR
jgi:uncharacterized membrane protein (DUF485 family)